MGVVPGWAGGLCAWTWSLIKEEDGLQIGWFAYQRCAPWLVPGSGNRPAMPSLLRPAPRSQSILTSWELRKPSPEGVRDTRSEPVGAAAAAGLPDRGAVAGPADEASLGPEGGRFSCFCTVHTQSCCQL